VRDIPNLIRVELWGFAIASLVREEGGLTLRDTTLPRGARVHSAIERGRRAVEAR